MFAVPYNRLLRWLSLVVIFPHTYLYWLSDIYLIRSILPLFGHRDYHENACGIMDSFLMQSGYVELAKTVHSIFASLTTVFLFTRLWARSTQYKGLWWDDYLRKSVFFQVTKRICF